MEVYLLSIVCWSAMNEVYYIDIRWQTEKSFELFQFSASADVLHGVFLTNIDEKLKRSVSPKNTN